MNTFGGLDAVLTALSMAREITGVEPANSVRDVVSTTPDLTRFAAVLDAAYVAVDELEACTVLAPDNAAFDRLDGFNPDQVPGALDAVWADAIVRRHVLPRVLTRDRLVTESGLVSLDGHPVWREPGNALVLCGGRIHGPETLAGNGVVHVIDTVLLPH